MHTVTLCASALALSFSSSLAAASESGFARPPDEPLVVSDERSEPEPFPLHRPESSFVRLYVGPALRLSEAATDGGLYAAFDLGARATGVRFSGAWLRAGADQGLSQYTGELWIDFGVGKLLHPQLAAGAGLARAGVVDAQGRAKTASLGVGVLRGSLDYVLPIVGEDARVGVDVIGNVPAIRSDEAANVKPWVVAAARVGIGF